MNGKLCYREMELKLDDIYHNVMDIYIFNLLAIYKALVSVKLSLKHLKN